ncbi:hypothetical protein ENUP19_0378G0023 [Entamoeba nuttalli]|uniref:3-oxoacyl-(Acyl-carrier protein) reductase n=1 Tax=Entamoeba nuttalli TaxID=412467 RepID=A0ABQ0DZ54_9EUKA
MSNTIPSLSPLLIQKNKDTIYCCKVIAAIGCGIVSGALGLVHIQGFIFMMVMYLLISILLYLRILPSKKDLFEGSYDVLFEAFFPFIMVALITGGTSGIGEAIVRQLTEQKCNVIFIGRRKELGESISHELNNKHLGQIDFIPFDVTNFKEYDSLVHIVQEKYNRLDLLVNNAGIVTYDTCDELTEETFDLIYQTNVKSVWQMTKHFHNLLEQSHGAVVNIGSDVSIKADPQYFGYSDSKAAVVHITKMMALQYAPNIRINAVCPGDTFVERWISDEELERRFGEEMAHDKSLRKELIDSMHHSIDIPLQRVGEVNDVANAVLFLGSNLASFITGTSLLVDGGASIV